MSWCLSAWLGLALYEQRQSHAANADAAEKLGALQTRLKRMQARQLRLEDEARASFMREQAMAGRLQEYLDQLGAQRQARKEAMRRARKPMPEGVRLALRQLHERMAADGHSSVRILRARGLERRQLLGVEAVLVGPYGIEVEPVLAARVRVQLDRSDGLARFVFLDGYRVEEGVEQPLPEEGHVVTLEAVDTEAWEAALPALVDAVGIATGHAVVRPRAGLDGVARRQWTAALDRLLAGSRDGVRYRIRGLQDLQDGEFRGVEIAGYDAGGMLAFRAEADRFAVEVLGAGAGTGEPGDAGGTGDAAAGEVTAVLLDGMIHRQTGSAPIPVEGFRILLPRLTAAAAEELMLGVVRQR